MKRIISWLRAFKKVRTVQDAELLGLHFQRNIYGDEINHLDCRSLWNDCYGNVYKIEELNLN